MKVDSASSPVAISRLGQDHSRKRVILIRSHTVYAAFANRDFAGLFALP